MDNFMRNEAANSSKTKEIPKRRIRQINNGGKTHEQRSTSHNRITNDTISPLYDDSSVFSNDLQMNDQPFSFYPEMKSNAAQKGVMGRENGQMMFHSINGTVDNTVNRPLNWGAHPPFGDSFYGPVGNMSVGQKINEDKSAFGTSLMLEKRGTKFHVPDDELVINPRSVFCSEDVTDEKTPKTIQIEKETIKELKKKHKKKSKENIKSSDGRKRNGKKAKANKRKTVHEAIPNPVPVMPTPLSNHYRTFKIDFKRNGMHSADLHKRMPPYVQNNFPMYGRPFPGYMEGVNMQEYPNHSRPLPPIPIPRYHHVSPNNSTLFLSHERKNIKINQDPFFFRVPQPTNNSLIMQDPIRTPIPMFHAYPPRIIPKDVHRPNIIKEIPSKNIIRLKVNAQNLYKYDLISIKGEEIPDLSASNISDGLFATYLNKFNDKFGIPQLSVKYAVVMSFLYNEIRKQKGYWNVKPGEWKNLSTMIKDFVRIKEIYLFLVYPFEQFLLGKTKVVRYKDPAILEKYLMNFLVYSVQDINFYLKRGSLEELDMMLYQLDVSRMTPEGFVLITTLLLDIFVTNIKKTGQISPLDVDDTHCDKENSPNRPLGKNKFKFFNKMEMPIENINPSGRLDPEYFKKIRKLDRQTSVKYIRRCVEISVEFGTMAQLSYKILDVSQQFLNKVFYCVLECREMNLFTWGEFYAYTNNCFRNFYPGTDTVYLSLYKQIKTNPLLVLRTLSNIRFSKVKTKRMYRRLSKYIFSSVERVVQQLQLRLMINDQKVLEYVISAFYLSKGFRKRIKYVVISILQYFVYLFHNKVYLKSKNGSDLFKIVTRLMLFEDISGEVYANQELIEEVKKIPGLGELI